MKTTIVKSIALLFIVGMAASSLATEYGGYAGAFLRMGLGARPRALGEAYTALAQGTYAGFYNPAGLPWLTSKELNICFSLLPLDRKFNYIGVAIPLKPKVSEIPPQTETVTEQGHPEVANAGLHLGWINCGVDNIDGRDSNGNPIGTFSNSENAFFFSFALSPHRLLSLGVNFKILYNRFPSMTMEDKAASAKGFGFDLGMLVSPLPGLTTGIVIKDLNSKYSWNTKRVWDWEKAFTKYDRFPRTIRWGLAYRIPGNWLLASFDWEDNDKQDGQYHLGVEFLSPQGLYLRAGLDAGEPTFGLGLELKVLGTATAIDYGYISNEFAPAGEHVFSWALRF
ncbi:MAG: hypothetical protein ONB05_06280 [candidate division KSB1 bacterium]|nr:hypothetical protein [candidate division KSB1 bacterium]